MTKYTRYTAIGLSLIQAIGYTFGLFSTALESTNALQNVIVIITMVAGTAFLMWLGDMITEKGIGNGISLIIFIGIISKLPKDLINTFNLVRIGELNIIKVLIFGLVFLFIIAFVVALQEGERRITVQYAKRVVGRKMYGGQSTHIPVKVSMAGVMPVIFASSLLAFPQTIAL